MSIYDLTYNKLGRQLLPPDKRNNNLAAFVTCLLAPMQWLRDLWLGSYRTGATAGYDPGITYDKYSQVVYQNAVYSSLYNGNIGTTPAPGSPWWVLVQNNFIGISERLLYNGQCIVLTWALNKWFGTSFVHPVPKAATVVQQIDGVATIYCTGHGFATGQRINISSVGFYPWFNGYFTVSVVDDDTFTYPLPGADFVPIVPDNGLAYTLSGIYLQNNFVANTNPFRVGVAGGQSSVVYTNKSTEVVINHYSFAGQLNFTIYVPLAAYATLGNTNAVRDATVRAFVCRYLPAGLLYSIQPY